MVGGRLDPQMNRRDPRQHGLTLVEVLVGLAIAGTVLAMAVPGLHMARKAARMSVCATRLRELGRASITYTLLFDGWLAGAPGTTGRALLSAGPPLATDILTDATQVWDWSGPVHRHGWGLRSNATSRPARILELRQGPLKCPSNDALSLVHPPPALESGWPGVIPSASYATIREFLYFGKQGNTDDRIRLPFWWNIRTPASYLPRVTGLARPATKAWLGEGVPYWPAEGPQDTPIGIQARYGGAGSSAGASSSFARAYPNNIDRTDSAGLPQDPQRDDHAYRHRLSGTTSAMNVLLFDGHVRAVARRDALLSVDLWYPSGSVVKLREFENGPFPKPAVARAIMQRGTSDGVFFTIH